MWYCSSMNIWLELFLGGDATALTGFVAKLGIDKLNRHTGAGRGHDPREEFENDHQRLQILWEKTQAGGEQEWYKSLGEGRAPFRKLSYGELKEWEAAQKGPKWDDLRRQVSDQAAKQKRWKDGGIG